jgi:hypothetical protein
MIESDPPSAILEEVERTADRGEPIWVDVTPSESGP